MNKVKIIFGRSDKIGSRLIRLRTGGRWSHCGLVAGDWVYESSAVVGVVKTPLHEFKARYDQQWEICEHDCEDVDLCFNRAKALLGSRYDYSSVFGILIRKTMNKLDAYHCSEMLSYCLGKARLDKQWKITPEIIWLYSKTIERGSGMKD
jgi:hypothetical protein